VRDKIILYISFELNRFIDEIKDQHTKETKYLSTFIPKDFSDEEMA